MSEALSVEIKELIKIEKEKIEEKEKVKYADIQTICPFCQKPTDGEHILHIECVEPYELFLSEQELFTVDRCKKCGCEIPSIEYRCPVCFSFQKPIHFPIHSEEINKRLNQAIQKEEENKRATIKNNILAKSKKYNQYLSNRCYEELLSEELDVENTIYDKSSSMMALEHCLTEINRINGKKENYDIDIKRILLSTIGSILLTIISITGFSKRAFYAYPLGLCAGALWINTISLIIGQIVDIINAPKKLQSAKQKEFQEFLARYRFESSERTTIQSKLISINNEYETLKKEVSNLNTQLETIKVQQSYEEFLFMQELSINQRGIIKEIQDDIVKSLSSIFENHKVSEYSILLSPINYKTGKITKDDFLREIEMELDYLPQIELDNFLSKISTMQIEQFYDDIFKALRYYRRLKCIITGKARNQDNAILKKFKRNFFNGISFDYSERSIGVNKGVFAIWKQSLYSFVPLEIDFNDIPSDECILASQTEKYVFDDCVSLYYSELHNTRYSDENLKEMGMYLFYVMCDLVGLAITIKNEKEEALRIEEEEERIKREEHERYVAELYESAARHQAEQARYESEERNNEIRVLSDSLNKTNLALNEMVSQNKDLAKKIAKIEQERNDMWITAEQRSRYQKIAKIMNEEAKRKR